MKIASMRLSRSTTLLLLLLLALSAVPAVDASSTSVQPAPTKNESPGWFRIFQRPTDSTAEEEERKKKEEEAATERSFFGGKQPTEPDVPVKEKQEEDQKKSVTGLFGFGAKKEDTEVDDNKEEVTGLFGFGAKKEDSEVDNDEKKEDLKSKEEPQKQEPQKKEISKAKEEPQRKEDSKVKEESQKKEEPKTEEPTPGFFSRKRRFSNIQKTTATASSPDDSDEVQKEETEEGETSPINITISEDDAAPDVNTTDLTSDDKKETKETNTTSSSPTFQFQPQPTRQQLRFPMSPPPQQQPGIIIMGLDGRPQRLPPGSSTGGRGLPLHPPTGTSSLIAETLAAVLSTGIRFWFLTSITRWFADEEIKSLKRPTQHFVWERLNDRYTKDHEALETALRAPPVNVGERKWRRHLHRQKRKEQRLVRRAERKLNKQNNVTKTTVTDSSAAAKDNPLMETFQRTVVVVEVAKRSDNSGELDFQHLEEVVSFLLTEHRRKSFGTQTGGNDESVELEVIILIESPGGGVSEFGLAASQMQRLSAEKGIITTVCVDKVGASGGYMIASQANKILAAPFAVLGSIGVIREGLNFNKALEKYGVAPLTLTAGEAKAPLTTYGEVTKRGVEIAQRQLNKTHEAFRALVISGRPALADVIDEVADGNIFLGREAKELSLVDEVMTSEEYILERVQAGDRVLKLHRMPHFLKNRRFPSIHPLDFLKENGQQWLAKQDVPQLVSRVLKTTSFLKFLKYFAEKNGLH